MLVVSRKQGQNICFPGLGVSVEIVRVAGKTVRVGVEAPQGVRVLRGELLERSVAEEAADGQREARHHARNCLNTANLALHLLQKQLEVGRVEDAERTLARAIDAFATVDQFVAASSSQGVGPQTAPLHLRKQMRRTLVVEDNANERELLVGFLQVCGYEATAVDDGLAAMQYLSENEPPDAVFLDMNLPNMDGRTTISAIRGNPRYRSTKLFVVSGTDRESMQVPLGEKGVDRWFTKPLKPTQFVNDVRDEMARGCIVA